MFHSEHWNYITYNTQNSPGWFWLQNFLPKKSFPFKVSKVFHWLKLVQYQVKVTKTPWKKITTIICFLLSLWEKNVSYINLFYSSVKIYDASVYSYNLVLHINTYLSCSAYVFSYHCVKLLPVVHYYNSSIMCMFFMKRVT